MDRRTFLAGTGVMLLATPLAAGAQQSRKMPRIGLLDYANFWAPLLEKLAELGYVEGQTIIFEYRGSEGQAERIAGLAQDLVQRRVDLIVTYGTPVTEAAKAATTTIPIVMVGIGDAVRTGLVTSLGHPGGNVTGNSILGPDIGAKRLQLLREALPSVARVAFLWNPQNASNVFQLENVQQAARELRLTLLSVPVHDPHELDDTLATMMKGRPHALMMTGDAVQQFLIGQIVQFAAARRLPTVFQVRENVTAGGLMSYGPSLPDLFRRAAAYVDRILKGARPADLPIEQPTKFELIINLKTTKALGLTIPPSLLARADQVIE